MDSRTHRKGPGTTYQIILRIVFTVLLVSGTSGNSYLVYGASRTSEPFYWAHGTSEPAYVGSRSSGLVYGAPRNSEPDYGARRTSESVYRPHGTSKPVYEAPRSSVSHYGARRTSESVYRPHGTSEPVYGAPRSSEPAYGPHGTSEVVYGASRSSEPDYGTPRNPKPTNGAPGNSELVYGALGTSEPVYGTPRSSVPAHAPPRSSEPTYEAHGNSEPVYGAHGTSEPVHGSETAYGTYGNSELIFGAPGNPELVYGPSGNSDLLYGASGNSELSPEAPEDTEVVSEVPGTPELASEVPGTPEQNCSSLVGFEAEVPSSAVNATELKICNTSDLSCCTPEMEEELVQTMENYFIDSLQSNVKDLSKFFERSHHKLVKNFIDVVELNRNESIDIFVRIYGILFRDGKIFSIYDHIISFYKNGYDEHILSYYFKKQFISLFELMNSHYTFDDKFKKCMETQVDWMEMVSPKDTKDLMGAISRSVTAVRAYTQGLLVGRDAIRSLMWYEPNKACVKELVRMRGCVQCSGNQGSPICSDYCLQVLAICFAKHMDFSNAWADYYYAMQRLQEKIENEYNIDDMINSLSVKLSDLIMDFQENSILIHEKVFAACGKPMHDSRKDGSPRVRRYTFPWNKKERKKGEVYRLIKNIQRNLQISFLDVCKDEQVSEYNCWSGSEVGNYTSDAFPESWRDANKSVKLHPDAIPLRLSTRKLRAAISNQDVEWLDYEHKIFEICWIGS